MIRHDHISIDGEAAGLSCFIKGLASNDLDCVGAEYWQAIFSYGRYKESGSISRDRMHEAEPQDQNNCVTERRSLSAHQAAEPHHTMPVNPSVIAIRRSEPPAVAGG